MLKYSVILPYSLRFCLVTYEINYLKTPKDLKHMNFRANFGAEDEGRLTPFKDDKPKDDENSLFQASSVPVI